MNFENSEELQATRDWARKYSREVVFPKATEHSRRRIELSFLKKLSQDGFFSLVIPESLGGLGLSSQAFSLVVRELARSCASTAVSVAVTNMIADVLIREGTSFQHDFYLKQLVDGRSTTASFCLSESGSGSDAAAMTTTVTKKGSKYIISGEKIYVTNGAFSQFFLVMVKHSEVEASSGKRKISAFLISRDQAGVVLGKEEDKMGLTGSSTLRMSFENVEVSEEHRVGLEGDGFKIAMRALDGGRISVSSQALGIAEAALEAGIRYAQEREAFGQPLGNFQAIQWKIADAATAVSASEALIMRAAWLKDQKRVFTREASQAKVFTTESAIRVCDDMIQIFGGYGYIKDYPVERYYRDVRVTALYEGTSEIQRLVIARSLLGAA